MTVTEWPARIRRFLTSELWQTRSERHSRLSAIRLLQFSIMLGEGFVRDRLLQRASALSYFTVLSLVPLLAVAVAIASAVGAGSDTFVDWVVDTLAAGAPETGDTIRSLIEDVDFASLGTAGGSVLLLTTVLAISSVEKAFNDIWGVESGRSLTRRFSDYLAVIVVAPLLSGLALSIVTTLRSRWAISQLALVPGLARIEDLGTAFVPVLLLSTTFVFLYWFLPNTRVSGLSALIGGVVAGVLVALAQTLYLEFSIGAARANTFFGGFALLPLLFAWIYVFWAIVLLGAEIAFAHQNFALYREEVRAEPPGPAEREAIALRIALEVARRFGAGGGPAEAAELAQKLRVPVRAVRSVAGRLVEAGILAHRSEDGAEEALQLGRPADSIAVSDVLGSLRGRRQAAHSEHEDGALVADLLGELEGTERRGAGGRTLAELLRALDSPADADPSASRGEAR